MTQPVLFHAVVAPDPVTLLTSIVRLSVAPGPTLTDVKPFSRTLMPVMLSATYGPTNGPPFPFGAAPAGWTDSVDVSLSARARFSRPLPVSAAVPAASAVRAS